MKLVILLMTLFQIAQGVAFIAIGFLVLMLLLVLSGLLFRNIPGAK